MKIAPSILSADFARLGEEIAAVDKAGGDLIHIDVMDGHFVPNITIGPCVIKDLRSCSEKPFDIHLMISNPEVHIKAFADSGADIITVHAENVVHLNRVISMIKDYGCKAGVALVPSTPEAVLDYVLQQLDLVLIMTVNPGFGGQEFLHSQLEKISKIKRKIKECEAVAQLSVDGGINEETARLSAENGADILVAGSYIFNHKSGYDRAIKELRCY